MGLAWWRDALWLTRCFVQNSKLFLALKPSKKCLMKINIKNTIIQFWLFLFICLSVCNDLYTKVSTNLNYWPDLPAEIVDLWYFSMFRAQQKPFDQISIFLAIDLIFGYLLNIFFLSMAYGTKMADWIAVSHTFVLMHSSFFFFFQSRQSLRC